MRRLKAIGKLFATVLVVAWAGCSGVETGSVWAPRAAATPLGRSYSWMAEPPSGGGSSVDAAVDRFVREVVDRGLAARGFRPTDSDSAECWVTYRFKKTVQGDPYSDDFNQYTAGTLAIYVVQPENRQWLWKGWAQARLEEQNPPEVKRKRLEAAVDQILEQLAPRKKGAGA
jgi:hypothetical protein